VELFQPVDIGKDGIKNSEVSVPSPTHFLKIQRKIAPINLILKDLPFQ
jgi:hypothetical protein